MTLALTEDLSMDILFGDPFLYARQRQVYDAAFGRGAGLLPTDEVEQDDECLQPAPAAPLQGPGRGAGRGLLCAFVGGGHSGSLRSAEGAPSCLPLLHHPQAHRPLQPRTAVVCVASERPDERPHPYIVSLLQEMVPQVYFTDAVHIPGLVEPAYHESVSVALD